MRQNFEQCDECGFAWDAIAPHDIRTRIGHAMNEAANLIELHSVQALIRRSPQEWSAVEYGCHMRDVLYNIRDKMVLITVEDNPASLPLYGVPRVELGLYVNDEPSVLAQEMRLAGELFGRTFDALPKSSHSRVFLYRYPREAMRTLMWVAAQALHETEHHASDVRLILNT